MGQKLKYPSLTKDMYLVLCNNGNLENFPIAYHIDVFEFDRYFEYKPLLIGMFSFRGNVDEDGVPKVTIEFKSSKFDSSKSNTISNLPWVTHGKETLQSYIDINNFVYRGVAEFHNTMMDTAVKDEGAKEVITFVEKLKSVNSIIELYLSHIMNPIIEMGIEGPVFNGDVIVYQIYK